MVKLIKNGMQKYGVKSDLQTQVPSRHVTTIISYL
jgi:hypothetical protein